MIYRHRLVRSLVVHFAEAASLEHPVRVFTRPESFEHYMAHRGGLTRGERLHLRNGYALSILRIKSPHDVYVNLIRHTSVEDLVDSAAHEVVHLRWPGLNGCTKPNSLFARRVSALRSGQRVGPSGSPLPAGFR